MSAKVWIALKLATAESGYHPWASNGQYQRSIALGEKKHLVKECRYCQFTVQQGGRWRNKYRNFWSSPSVFLPVPPIDWSYWGTEQGMKPSERSLEHKEKKGKGSREANKKKNSRHDSYCPTQFIPLNNNNEVGRAKILRRIQKVALEVSHALQRLSHVAQ